MGGPTEGMEGRRDGRQGGRRKAGRTRGREDGGQGGRRGGKEGGRTNRTGGSPRETKLGARSLYVVLLARPDAVEEMFEGELAKSDLVFGRAVSSVYIRDHPMYVHER